MFDDCLMDGHILWADLLIPIGSQWETAAPVTCRAWGPNAPWRPAPWAQSGPLSSGFYPLGPRPGDGGLGLGFPTWPGSSANGPECHLTNRSKPFGSEVSPSPAHSQSPGMPDPGAEPLCRPQIGICTQTLRCKHRNEQRGLLLARRLALFSPRIWRKFPSWVFCPGALRGGTGTPGGPRGHAPTLPSPGEAGRPTCPVAITVHHRHFCSQMAPRALKGAPCSLAHREPAVRLLSPPTREEAGAQGQTGRTIDPSREAFD
jgi:hypothetical protein